MIEIEPASLTQVIRGKGGRLVYVDDDVCGYARNLRDIDPSLRLAYNEVGEYYVVYQVLQDGSEHLVSTAQELDGRLVERIRKVTSSAYDPGRELDLLHDAADREHGRQFTQRVGEVGERLAHAIRQDLQIKRNL
jgi:hypothetical protein